MNKIAESESESELYNRFKILHCQFLRHGKHEHRNDLVLLLNGMLRRKLITQEDYQKSTDMLDIEMVEEDEMLRQRFITQEDYQKSTDTLDIEMVEGEEIKEDETEVLKRLLKPTIDYLVTHDKDGLKELKMLKWKPLMNMRTMF